MSDIPERENPAAEAKRLHLRADGMEPIGWIFIDPDTGRRATLDYFGRVHRWEVDGSGRMHAESARFAELESERAELRDARDAAWDRIGELEAEKRTLHSAAGALLRAWQEPNTRSEKREAFENYMAVADRMGLNSEGED